MANFCSNCGTALNEGVKFCPECGESVQQNITPQAAPPAQPDAAPSYAGSGAVRQGIPSTGFSNRVNDPKILAAVKKNRRAAGIFSLILVPLPLIGFVIYSIFSDKMETAQAAKYGGFISVVFLVFTLYGIIKQRASNAYEATVIDKKSHRAYRHNSSDDNSYYTEYITVVRTLSGKKKKIVEREGSQIWAWNYLNVGDRFRYHPQFNFPYELYDKSRAPYIVCVSCATKNPIEADCCQKCGLPLLK
ncbi:MAG: zinc-ribbon domain-containing protein [Clostridia bacterium]|nr:zinc-ribbon domain-containing protein [Clostridia bacterium]